MPALASDREERVPSHLAAEDDGAALLLGRLAPGIWAV